MIVLAVRLQLAAAPAEEAGRTGEALELHEGQRPVGPGIEADHRAELRQGDLADHGAVGRVAGDAGGGRVGGDDQQAAGDRLGVLDDARTLGHEGRPLLGRHDAVEGDGDDPAAGRVERRDGDQPRSVEAGVGDRVDALDERPPLAGLLVPEVQVGPGPADERRDEREPSVGRGGHVGPRFGRGQLGPHQLVVGPRLAEAVTVDAPVVLIPHRVAGVEERRAVRRPRDAGGAGLGDLVAQVLPGLDVEDAEDAALVAGLGDAVGDEPAVERRVVPVDGRRRVGRQRGRIDQEARRGGRLVDRPDHERQLLLAAAALQREHTVTGQADARRDGQLEQADEAGQPRPAVGSGVERGPGAFVLGRDPRGDLGRVAVLEPSVGVRHLPAVQHVRRRLPPRRRRRGQHGSVNAPCWDACRGWPWSAACAPSSSSSSWT